MKQVIKIIPQGYCKGVVCAIKNINKVLKENNYKRPLYMLGGLVHNKHVTDALNDLGIITVDDYHHLKAGTIIVTAHGLSFKEKDEIRSLGLDLIDETCSEVLKIQDLVLQKINEGYKVLYYGKLNHPECKAVISISDNITLIKSIDDVKSLDLKEDKIFFTNQTTMSYFDTLEIIDELNKKYPNLLVNIDICNASKMRQLAVKDACTKCDMILIVGDVKSNNTMKLKEIVEKENVKAYLIEDIKDLNKIDFENYNIVGVTAGASTPNKLVNEIIKTLNDPTYISVLSNYDYIDL